MNISKELRKKLDEAWLGIDIDEKDILNPLEIINNYGEDSHLILSYLMMQPDYFGFLCKEVLNIELTPMQMVMLYHSWRRKFPMWIGSRGLSKCGNKDTKVITNKGIKTFGQILDNIDGKQNIDLQVLTEKGNFIEIDYGWYNGISKSIYLETRMGYNFEGTYNHPLRIVSGEEIAWCNLEDIKLEDYIIVDRSNIWPDIDNDDITEDIAYAFGCLIGDGGYTVRGRISFTTADVEFIPRLNSVFNKLYNKEFKKVNAKYEYCIWSVEIWNDLFQKYGFNSSKCSEKDIPKCIWSCSKNKIAAFLRGLFDTDGGVYTQGGVCYCSKSKSLTYNVQYLLSRFGIISRVAKRLNKKYNRYYYHLNISGNSCNVFETEIGFSLSRKKESLSKNNEVNRNTNIDILPHKLILDKLLILTKKYKEKYIVGKHGYCYERQLLSTYRLKLYEISYLTLKKILDLTDKIKDEPEWQFLNDIYQKNYFYDKVTKLESTETETYDLHLKEDHSFISNSFISHNSFLEGVYCLLRAILIPGRNIIICGSVFRQSKIVFEYIERIYKNSPRLQEICEIGLKGAEKVLSKDTDMWKMRIGQSNIMSVPVGNTGEGVRGLRANDLIVEEFAAHSREIFEVILSGFTAVSSDPLQKIKVTAAENLAKKLGITIDEIRNPFIPSNQLLICGTAYYQFNHFYDYWRKWKTIIETRGDLEKIKNLLGENAIEGSLNPDDYVVFRIPVELIPAGFMDESQVTRSKASMHSGNYACEFGASFVNDSAGFFKRSLVESCVASERNNIILAGEKIVFHPTLRGLHSSYIMAIDPASEHDNFAIVILEVHPNHRRIVYCWTITRKEQKQRIKDGLIQENDFYRYCTMKVKELMKNFKIDRIAIDSQGGRPISEALSSSVNLEKDELPIYEIIDSENYKATDSQAGLHIIEMINFADATWTSDANHGMRKDFEDKLLLFPHFDPLSIGFAAFIDTNTQKVYDTLEDCVNEIEELKDELSTIIISSTATGRERWDTPDTKTNLGKKGRMRKDRYSALLMANATAKKLTSVQPPAVQNTIGGFSYDVKYEEKASDVLLYHGPVDLVQKLQKLYDGV